MALLLQIQMESENSDHNVKPPLISVDSAPFVVEKITTACTLGKFLEDHNLEFGVHSVFVESSRSQSSLENAEILDVILEDKVSVHIIQCFLKIFMVTTIINYALAYMCEVKVDILCVC